MTSPVLLLHGITGTPAEMSTLEDALKQNKVPCAAPLLPGHGTTLQELSNISVDTFLTFACEQAEKLILSARGEISIVGQSFGALLTLFLAQEYRASVSKVVLLAPPFHLRNSLFDEALTLLSLLPESFYSILPCVKKKERDLSSYLRPRECYSAFPLSAVCRMLKVRRQVLEKRDRIRCGIFYMIDPLDHHVAPEFALETILSRSKSYRSRAYRNGAHELLIGPRGEEVCNDILSFLSEENTDAS